MKNDEFEKWLHTTCFTAPPIREKLNMQDAFEAGQSASAARIEELGQGSWAETLITEQEKNQGLQQAIAELTRQKDIFQYALQYIADDTETQTCGHFGMNRLASYAKDALPGGEWLDEFAKDERIAELESEIAGIKQNQFPKRIEGITTAMNKRIAALEADNKRLKDCLFQMQESANELTQKTMVLTADCKAMADGILKAHKYNGAYVVADYSHPEFETSHDRHPCTCPACTIAAKYREG